MHTGRRVLFGNLDKIGAARIQINCAIEMLFEGKHPIAVHTVVMAGSRIVRDLASRTNSPFLQNVSKHVADGDLNQFWRQTNIAANFFKHADNDPEDVFPGIDERVNEFAIFTAAMLLKELSAKSTPEIESFFAWFFSIYPEMLVACNARDFVLQTPALMELRQLSRSEQLKCGLSVLRKHQPKN